MINVFKPEILSSDIRAVNIAIRNGDISGNFGKSIPLLEKNFSKFIGSNYSVAVSSGSAALHLSIAALEFEKGSEIILSSTTNIATALAVTHNNCVPIPVDSDFDTWNIDIKKIEKKITKKTKAILLVHFLGNPVEINAVQNLAKKYNLKIIEDAAEAHGAELNKKKVGNLGYCGCFSFYANKIISSGEGGIVTTNNKLFYKKLLLYRNLGFTKPRFVHYIQGFNFRMTGYQAALVNNQLKRIKEIIKKKTQIYNMYYNELKSLKCINFQKVPPNSKAVYWMVGIYINTLSKISNNQLRSKLEKKGIETRNFFKSISNQPCFKNYFKINKHKTPNSDLLWKNGLYLPSSHNIKISEIKKICKIIKNILK